MESTTWQLSYSFLKTLLKHNHRERTSGYYFSKGLHILFRTQLLRKPFLEFLPSEPRDPGPVTYGIISHPPLTRKRDTFQKIERFIRENQLEDSVFLTDTTFTYKEGSQDFSLFGNTFLENTHLYPSFARSAKRYRIYPIQNTYGDGVIIVREVLYWSKTVLCLMPCSRWIGKKRHYLLAINANEPLSIKEDIATILKNMLENPAELSSYAVSFAEIHF
jgi:hypothetical protein